MAHHNAPPKYLFPQVADPAGDGLPHRVQKAQYFRDPKNFFGINVQPVDHVVGPHWHPNADEFDYFLGGHGTVQILGPGEPQPLTYKVKKGDALVIPQGSVHFYIKESGADDPLTFLAVFNNSEFRVIDSASVPAS